VRPAGVPVTGTTKRFCERPSLHETSSIMAGHNLYLCLLVFGFAAAAAQSSAVTRGFSADSKNCTEPNPTNICFQERVLFFEGLILWGVLLLAALMGTTCLAALNTPTKFPEPKERTD
jgi:hypothetical protein